jgi:hypothetical protein
MLPVCYIAGCEQIGVDFSKASETIWLGEELR